MFFLNCYGSAVFDCLHYYCDMQLQSHVMDLANVYCPFMYDMIVYLLLSLWSVLEIGKGTILIKHHIIIIIITCRMSGS